MNGEKMLVTWISCFLLPLPKAIVPLLLTSTKRDERNNKRPLGGGRRKEKEERSEASGGHKLPTVGG
tara:strand:- start:1128 stop:1328 length:201 start_codon:yes stop_codon:yes gene_type:complete